MFDFHGKSMATLVTCEQRACKEVLVASLQICIVCYYCPYSAKKRHRTKTFLILVTKCVARIRYRIFSILKYPTRNEPSLHVENGIRIKIRYQC